MTNFGGGNNEMKRKFIGLVENQCANRKENEAWASQTLGLSIWLCCESNVGRY